MTAVAEPSTAGTDGAVLSPPAEPHPLADEPGRSRRLGRRSVLVGLLSAVVVGGGAAVVRLDPFGRTSGDDDSDDATTALAGTSLAEVEQRTLMARSQLNGTLGYTAGPDIVSQLTGMVTGLPAVGQVISQGEVPFAVSNIPVVMLYGTVPAYRDLPAGSSTADTTGPDIQQLNAALVALGYASAEDVDTTSNKFDSNTKAAVRKLQDALGVDDTGTLTLGSVVFVPGPVRVTAMPNPLGAPIASGEAVLNTSSTTPIVTVEVEAARQTEIHQGDTVTITLPDNTSAGGVVAKVSSVAITNESDETVITVEITLNDATVAGALDEAPVLVAITTASVEDAVVVPVTALLAMAGGGYAVEVDDGSGIRRIVPVKLGLFDDSLGLVQVTDTELQVGQQVVVPAT
jgi:peptidoglycan hydrolase-like protein with peptidoglycan-binding domain